MALSSAYTTVRLFLDGMLSMMALYALLSYFQQRKPIYWQYALYIGCMILDLQLSDLGYSMPGYQPGAFYPETFVESIAFILYVRFAILLLNVAGQDPLSHRLMRLMINGFAIALLLDTVLWLTDVSISTRSSIYMTTRLVACAVGLYLIPRIFRLRNTVVSYFIAGSLLLLIGSLAALLVNYLPANHYLQRHEGLRLPVTLLQIGVVGEVLCFTLGMSLRNRQNERDKIQYQAQLIDQLRENEQKQQKLQRLREDIARDLHDDIGADLASISLLSQAAARQLDYQPSQVPATLKTIGQTARQVVAAMREIVWSLNSAQTSLMSFCQRLQESARVLFEHQPIQVELTLPSEDPTEALPIEGRRDLFLMTKEMLHNVTRHAHATHVFVTVHVEHHTMIVTVRDDGCGFDPLTETISMGNGLRTMRQRADALGGQITIESQPGKGTTISFYCPLQVSARVVA